MAPNLPRVIICGAGVGGLTVAHELAKAGVSVTLYERNASTGGLARSAVALQDGYKYPIEYSWRIYGTGYKNLRRVLSEIPQQRNSKRSVADRLKKLWTYIIPRFDRQEILLSRTRGLRLIDFSLSFRERLRVLKKILTCATMSIERIDSLDDLAWKDFCSDLSPEAQKYLVKLWGPILGMDPSRVSFSAIARMVWLLLGGSVNAVGSFFLLTQPTSLGWFDAWQKYLQRSGNVEIKTNCEVVDMVVENGRLERVVLHDRERDTLFVDSADEYVCALSVESIAELTERNDALSEITTFQNCVPLADIGRQMQLSVQIFLDEKIVYPTKDIPVLAIVDAPWALIIEQENLVWGKTHCSDPRVKSVLSVGICHTDVPGIVFGKPFIQCTEDEVRQEVLAQLNRAIEASSIRLKGGGVMSAEHVIAFKMWDSFTYDRERKVMDTWEPKFSNNAGGLRYMPSTETELPNVWFATGYTQTHRFLYSMESAAEAGMACANAILRKYHRSQQVPVHVFRSRPFVFAPFIWLDKVLFAIGLPHPGASRPKTS